MRLKKVIETGCIAIILSGCARTGSDAGAIEFNRIDSFLTVYGTMTPADRSRAVQELSEGLNVYAALMELDASDLDSAAEELSGLPAVNVFGPDVLSRFTAVDSIRRVLGAMEQKLASDFPGTAVGEVYTVVSPYRQSIVVGDSMTVIALNHYLGADYPGYGSMETFRRALKTPRHLPYDVAEALISVNYPMNVTSCTTVLERMIYDGAVLAAVMDVVPDADLTEALGYTSGQLKAARDGEHAAWDALIRQNLLYSTSDFDAARLLGPAPYTSGLFDGAPGRMGRFIGYNIVKSYLDNNKDITLHQLLSDSADKGVDILLKSGYKP